MIAKYGPMNVCFMQSDIYLSIYLILYHTEKFRLDYIKEIPREQLKRFSNDCICSKQVNKRAKMALDRSTEFLRGP